MPTTPPEKVSRRRSTTRRDQHLPRDQTDKSWWSSPWLPLGPLVAGLALALGFHVTLRLWEQTKTHEPLDLSPPFAANPLPGTSLDSLMRRYGNQLSPRLNPIPPPESLAPPPPTPALPPSTSAQGPAPSAQQQTTLTVPPLPQPAPPAPAAPGAADPIIPLPPLP